MKLRELLKVSKSVQWKTKKLKFKFFFRISEFGFLRFCNSK